MSMGDAIDTRHQVEKAQTQEAGLPVSPSLGPALDAADVAATTAVVDRRTCVMCLMSIVLAVAAAVVALVLMRLIGLVTNLSYHHTWSTAFSSPADPRPGWPVFFIPAIGGIIVGLMARYGSAAIRGHGIPEAMEQVLTNQSRIPARLTFLKPLSAAIAIGTGGPFGAEGPIIATGGAMGSLIGQILKTTADERKTLLAAGAAAGMTATFGSPVSAVLLAIELLLFEFRPRSFIPVALGCATAAGMRSAMGLSYPVFPMPGVEQGAPVALLVYVAIGAIAGLASVYITRAVYWTEDLFDHLPLHWMWWPAIGAIPVGVIGYFSPHTLGVGYDNITNFLSAKPAVGVIVGLTILKLVSWTIALGSGTSGGTLAPLFTVGSGLGLLLGLGAQRLLPAWHIDPRVAALVAMAALFAGASRAMLTSAVFAFETTLQTAAILPLLGGCAAAYLVSGLMMRTTIMTEKLHRRGVVVPAEYAAVTHRRGVRL